MDRIPRDVITSTPLIFGSGVVGHVAFIYLFYTKEIDQLTLHKITNFINFSVLSFKRLKLIFLY